MSTDQKRNIFKVDYAVQLRNFWIERCDSCYLGESTQNWVDSDGNLATVEWKTRASHPDTPWSLEPGHIELEDSIGDVSYTLPDGNGLLLLGRKENSDHCERSWKFLPQRRLERLRLVCGLNEVHIGDPNQLYAGRWDRLTGERYTHIDTIFSDGVVNCSQSFATRPNYSGYVEFDVSQASWAIHRTLDWDATTASYVEHLRLVTSVDPTTIVWKLTGCHNEMPKRRRLTEFKSYKKPSHILA